MLACVLTGYLRRRQRATHRDAMSRTILLGATVLLLGAAGAPVVRAAEPLTSGQRHAKSAGSVLRVAIPAGGLALTYVLDPATDPNAGAGRSALLLMGGTPRHDLLLAVARTWVVTAGLKYAINETRPNGEPHSFPSGHSSIAFSGAEFIRKEYGWGWGAPAYLAAGFVGWSRVEARKHYAHDVVAGAALGVLANHDFWLRRDAGGELRLSTAVFESGRVLAPGLRLQWTH
jgi:membrane-associated phospholipid phosphatase